MTDIIDNSSPEEIRDAIEIVRTTPGKRIKPGEDALLELLRAPDHTMPFEKLDAKFGNLNAHFGWFCQRVANELGDENPLPFALTDKSTAADGSVRLTLKPSVVAALRGP